VNCIRCNKEFEPNPKTVNVQKYCSHSCCIKASVKRYLDRKRAAKVNLPRPVFSLVCVICGKEFNSLYSTQLTCSLVCKKKKDNRRSTSGSIHSKVKKVPCEVCGFSDLRAIHRHHLDISNGNAGGVICLCANCHRIYHSVTGSKQVKATWQEVVDTVRIAQKQG